MDKDIFELVREINATVSVCKQWAVSNIPQNGLSQARMYTLIYLRDNGSSPMRDLKNFLGTSPTNITGLVDGLEQDGFVTRVADPEDRRVTRIVITDSGKRRLKNDWQQYEANCAQSLKGLDKLSRQKILSALTELRLQIQHTD